MKTLRLCAAALASLLLTGCETVGELTDCVCSSRSGNPKLDSYFTAGEELQAASVRVDTKLDAAVSDLALSLGLNANAGNDEIHTALCDAYSNVGVSFDVSYEPPECRSEVDIAARAAAECDVAVDPGEVDIECEGRCEGTCRASCTGECRLPSVKAYCEGTCYGTCEAEVNAVCYGTCHGDCSGNCNVIIGGVCHGSCDATCTGTCEREFSGSCTGECHGECEIDVQGGDCNARCDGVCEGRCEGHCDGEVRAPQVDVDCEAQLEARADARVECDPPVLVIAEDVSAIANISVINANLARVIAATAEVSEVILALDSIGEPLGNVTTAIIDGELSVGQAACATTQVGDMVDAIDGATATLGNVVSTETTIMAVCL